MMKGAAEVASGELGKVEICLASWQNCRKIANYVFEDN